MLKIYGADLSSPANKVRFVANYLKLEYEYVYLKIAQGENRTPEFLSINPTGKIPAIDDDGFVLYESEAIIRYFAEKHGSELWPKDICKRAIVDQWMTFSTIHIGGGMNRVLFNRVFAPRIGVPVDENSLKDGVKFLNRFLPVAEQQLSKGEFLAGGSISLADFTLLSVLDPAEIGEIDLTKYEHITPWRNKLKKEDFYQKCYPEYGEALKGMA